METVGFCETTTSKTAAFIFTYVETSNLTHYHDEHSHVYAYTH
jgi:hypothetical protein